MGEFFIIFSIVYSDMQIRNDDTEKKINELKVSHTKATSKLTNNMYYQQNQNRIKNTKKKEQIQLVRLHGPIRKRFL